LATGMRLSSSRLEVEPLCETGRVLGVDWGVKETATTTDDAYDLPHAEHGKRAAQRLARYQRMIARRRRPKGQPASAGYRQAQAQAAKLHKKVARQREDTARKWAKSVMRGHDGVAVEDFRSRFLAKTTMARKAADAAIAATKRALVEMGRKHGRDVRLVHPAHTTMDCARCGARTKHALPLSMRTCTYTACAAVSPRDKAQPRPGRTPPPALPALLGHRRRRHPGQALRPALESTAVTPASLPRCRRAAGVAYACVGNGATPQAGVLCSAQRIRGPVRHDHPGPRHGHRGPPEPAATGEPGHRIPAARLPALPGRAGGAPVNAAVEQDNDTVLLGIATMRETAALLHGRDDGPEAPPPVAVSWNPHRELRGHLGLLPWPSLAPRKGRRLRS
jgi:hypothetical protein